jgi:quinolinate synthase
MDLKSYTLLTNNELVSIINEYKQRRNALILAHYYTRPEVQQVADFCGDSLELAKMAAKTENPVIVFCGVLFMAETAKILNPDKLVLIPDIQAGCPLASSAAYEDVLLAKSKNPGATVVAYINTSAEVKSAADICCTSSNAEKIVASIPDGGEIIFLPDKNLGANTGKKSGRKMQLWNGECFVHSMITGEYIDDARKNFPDGFIMVHPECPPETCAKADFAGSTSAMRKIILENPERLYLLGTENGLMDSLLAINPNLRIKPLKETAICGNMKLITLPKLARCLKEGIFEVNVEKSVADKARKSLQRMLDVK